MGGKSLPAFLLPTSVAIPAETQTSLESSKKKHR